MLRALAIAGLTFAIVAMLALLALATPPGRGLVIAMVERAAAGSGVGLVIERPRGWLPFSFGAERIVLADRNGPFADVVDLDVEINAPALLVGTVVLNAVAAERIRIDRTPTLPGGGAAGEGGGPDLAIAALDVRRLELGPALAGREATLQVTGAARLDGSGALQVALEASRVDGRRGRLVAALSRPDARSGFAGSLSLTEDDNGVLIGLLGRTAGPAYQLEAALTPTATGQRGDVTLGSAGAARLDGEFVFDTGQGSRRMALRADGSLGEFVPDELADLLGGRIDVDIDGDWSASPFAVQIRRGEIRTATVDAAMTGALSETAANLSLEAQIAHSEGGPVRLPGAQASFDSASVRGTVAPAAGVIRLDLAGHVAGLTVGDITVPGLGWSAAAESAGGRLPGETIEFAVRAEADEIAGNGRRLIATADAPLVLSADGRYAGATGLGEVAASLRGADGEARFTGSIGASVAGSATLSWADVAPLAAVAGLDAAGALGASVEGVFAGAGGADVSLEATVARVNMPSAEATRLLAGETRVTARLRETNGRLFIEEVTVSNGQILARGAATLDGDVIDATAQGDIADLGRVLDASSGAAIFSVEARGPIARPQVSARVEMAEGTVVDRDVRAARLEVDGGPDADGNWRGPVTFRGGVAGASIEGAADVVVDAATGRATLPRLQVALADNTIDGELRQVEGGLFTGRLVVEAPQLDQLAALAGAEATGALRGEVDVQPEGDSQSVVLAFTGDRLRYGETTVGSVAGSVRVADALRAPRISGEARARSVVAGDVALATVDAVAEASGVVTRFSVGAVGDDIDLRGAGSFTADTSAAVLQVDALSGSAFGSPIALDSPVVVRFDGLEGDVANARLAVGGGTVAVDVRALDALDIAIRAEAVAAATVNGFVPGLGAEGAISGEALVSGSPEAPRIAWSLAWADGGVAASRSAGLPAFGVVARGNATAAATSIEGRVSQAGLDLAFAGDVPFAGPGLSLAINGPAPLGLLEAQSDREVRLDGTADVSVTVTGSLIAPRISGSVALGGVTAIDIESGFGLSGATGRIVFDGEQATLEGVTGRLAQGGDATVSGTILTSDPALPASLTATVRNGRYVDGNAVNASFNADLVVNGPLAGAAEVSGLIALGRTEIQLPDLPTGNAVALETRHVNAPPDFQPLARPDSATGAQAGGAGGQRLSVNLTANQGIIVRGFGVDAEFGGALALGGTTTAPSAVGAFDMVWGRLEVLGRRFTLDTGRLTFSGDLVPVVALSASTTTTDAVVTVNVTGRADDPTISFTSSPPLPEEEILSRLLFQQSAGNLSALQAVQLVDALGQLTGVTGGQGIFTRVRNALGVDDLDVRETESGGTAVGVGTRINERIRLGVEAGSDTDGGRVTIDLDLTENLKARGEADGQGGSKVGITFEREY